MYRFRTIATAFVLGLVALGLLPGSASAVPTPANFFYVVSPVVVRPAMPVPLSVGLGNTAKTSVKVQVTFHGYCWDVGSRRIDFAQPSQIVTVPGDPSRPAGATPLRRVIGLVTIPDKCVAQPDVFDFATQDGEFFADFGSVGKAPQGTFASHFWIGKTFIAANIRYNLGLKTHGIPATSQAHHTLPQKWRDKFLKVGINIDDPANLRWWCSKTGVPTNHQAKSAAYNALWDTWFKDHKTYTKAQVLAYRDSIQKRFVYACPGVANYPGFP